MLTVTKCINEIVSSSIKNNNRFEKKETSERTNQPRKSTEYGNVKKKTRANHIHKLCAIIVSEKNLQLEENRSKYELSNGIKKEVSSLMCRWVLLTYKVWWNQ